MENSTTIKEAKARWREESVSRAHTMEVIFGLAEPDEDVAMPPTEEW